MRFVALKTEEQQAVLMGKNGRRKRTGQARWGWRGSFRSASDRAIGRVWLKFKNLSAPLVRREAEEDWQAVAHPHPKLLKAAAAGSGNVPNSPRFPLAMR